MKASDSVSVSASACSGSGCGSGFGFMAAVTRGEAKEELVEFELVSVGVAPHPRAIEIYGPPRRWPARSL